jgi:type I restriction enzyme S subunit
MLGTIPYWGANGVVDRVGDHLFAEPLVLLGEDGAPFFDRLKPVAFYVSEKVWVNNHIHVLRPGPGVEPRFLVQWLNTVDYGDFIDGSTRDKLTQGKMVDIPVAVPPLPTQRRIADFLDRKTAAIDALIEKKQKLLGLLAEKRAALINQAVTKGLDPNVPMKDSGVPWIGEIPAHWEVSSLRWVRRPGTSITYGIVQAGPHVEDGVPYIRVSEMSGDEFPPNGYKRTSTEIDSSYRRSKVTAGDLVVAIRAGVGKTLKVPSFLDGANLTQGTAKVSVRRDVSTDYVFWAMQAPATQASLDEASKGATFKEITLETLRKLALPLPPSDEQWQVAEFLSKSMQRLMTVQASVRNQLNLLQEYRQALITAAVTGQLELSEEHDP